jgi:Co/Zn/Cd efflux system component
LYGRFWRKWALPVAPEALFLTAIGLGALVGNLTCAILLARYRRHSGSLTKAALLLARNDALANLGLATLVTRPIWPDLIVGLAIAAMNIDAARAVWSAARDEHRTASPQA